jgi:hypothetical protein
MVQQHNYQMIHRKHFRHHNILLKVLLVLVLVLLLVLE